MRAIATHEASRRSAGARVLLPAALLLLFSNGITPLAFAAWLAPLFLLRFVRTHRAQVGLPIAFGLLAVTGLYAYRGMVPPSGGAAHLIGALFAIPAIVPYIVDRLLHERVGRVANTLVFPCAWVATEFAISLTPGATWGLLAYTQYGDLALLQVVSLAGPWIVTFLVAWLAPVGCLLWEEGWASPPAWQAAVAFAATLGVVVAFGEARLTFSAPPGRTVRVASFSRGLRGDDRTRQAFRRLATGSPTPDDLAEIRTRQDAVNDTLLARTEREARAGAKIVFWSEGNARVFKPDEAAFIDRGREVARVNRIVLGMALSTWTLGRPRPRENKLVLVDSTGAVAWQYLKARPVPGAESKTVAGDGRLRVFDASFGRATSAICYDADFPDLIAQAGAMHAGILLVPGDDWRGIDPLHTRMASFRAIEQGVSLVRQTSNGRSAAYDPWGRVLAEVDYFDSREAAMVAEVPARGVHTLYSWAGDWFAWACTGALALLIAGAARARKAAEDSGLS